MRLVGESFPVLRSAGGIGSGWESTDERDADLGVVETDSDIRHTFRLTNSSVEPMEIVGFPGEVLLVPVIAAIDRAKSVLADSRDRAAGSAEDDGTEEGK